MKRVTGIGGIFLSVRTLVLPKNGTPTTLAFKPTSMEVVLSGNQKTVQPDTRFGVLLIVKRSISNPLLPLLWSITGWPISKPCFPF